MISRYGVQSMANSFDQVGVLAKTVEDAKILFDAVKGFDPMDMTSIDATKLQSSKATMPEKSTEALKH